MKPMRLLLATLTLSALAVTVICLGVAATGNFLWMRYAETPLCLITFASWLVALLIASRVAEADSKVFFPGLKQFVGLWLATRRAPIWAVLVSACSLLALLFLGASGSVHELPTTPTEAKIAGSAILGFLSISLPTVLTMHPAANRLSRHHIP